MKNIDFIVNYYWRPNYPETIRLSAWLAIQSLKIVDIVGDILLVDGSLEGDNEIRLICEKEKIMYVHKGKELRFAEGYNCWKMLSSQYIGLMASDIIVNPIAIQKLYKVITVERVGCVFPYLDRCDYQGQIYSYVRKAKTCEPTFMTLNLNIFKREVLEYKYHGRSIVEVLETTVAEAVEFFTQKEIKNKLKHIVDVGLHYMTLGQPLDTLSGGECQRLKLAKELSKKGNIYIMDEPTTGLHMSDITSILTIIDRLVDKGNTVIVIEHNLDVIRNADWIIDVGVEGGSRGGQILFEGTPGNLRNCKESITTKYL